MNLYSVEINSCMINHRLRCRDTNLHSEIIARVSAIEFRAGEHKSFSVHCLWFAVDVVQLAQHLLVVVDLVST